MGKLLIFIVTLISLEVSAENCISKYNEVKLFSENIKGKQIHFPFIIIQQSISDEGKYETYIKKFKKGSLSKIIEVVRSNYLFASPLISTERSLFRANNYIELSFSGINNGYSISFKFEKIDSCWKLVEFTDESA